MISVQCSVYECFTDICSITFETLLHLSDAISKAESTSLYFITFLASTSFSKISATALSKTESALLSNL